MTDAKRCNKCGITKPISDYYISKINNGLPIYRLICKKCFQKNNQASREKRMDINANIVTNSRESIATVKWCRHCNGVKPISEFNIRRDTADGHDRYCRECHATMNHLDHHKHKELSPKEYEDWRIHVNDLHKIEKRRIKTEAFSHYCNGEIKCANPFHLHNEDITDLDILTLDHINGDGYKHKDKNGRRIGGVDLYRKVIKWGFPEEFQVLCANCQLKKMMVNKEHSPGRWAHPYTINP